MKLFIMDKSTFNMFSVIAVLSEVALVMEMYVPMPMNVQTTDINHHTKPVRYTKKTKFKLNGPNDTKLYQFKDEYHTLIGLKHFKFVINPRICQQEKQEDLLLLIMVPTSPQNFVLRSTIRNIWRQHFDFVKVVFLLGLSNTSISEKVKEEAKIYSDIVQGNFNDAYKNLTYKHTMGLKWVAHHCGTAHYILKLDDDVFVHVKKLRSFLTRTLSPWGAKDLLACRPSYDREVKRTGKWAVSQAEISEYLYPEYCMGYFILYSQDVVRRLLERVQKLPYLWIDDVQITGFAARDINVTITPIYNMAITYRQSDELMEDTWNSKKHLPFGPNLVSDKMVRHMWKMVILNDDAFVKWKKLIGRHKPKCFLPKTFRLWNDLPSEDFPEDCDMGLFKKGWRMFFKELQKLLPNATVVANKTSSDGI